MKELILRFKTVPRWAILLLDLLLLTWAFTLSYFIAKQFNFAEIVRGHFFIYTAVYSGLVLPVFYFMRIHTGLIRYSDTRDMLKIFSAMLITSVAYVIVIYSALVPLLGIKGAQLRLVMLINFFIGTSLLVMLRITVKSIYFILTRKARDLDTVRVLIYGADQNAIMAKQALENSTETKFIIVGFIDINRGKLNSYIERKRVYHIKDLAALKDKYAIDQM